MPSLDWTNREQDLTKAARTHYRLLKPVASQSVGQGSDNMLIEGDNLEALKALRPYIGGQVKCVFIDPPYNTNQDFEHYKDSLKHSQWLSLMYPRLEILRDLLMEEGSIWITLDDNEAHYFKVIADEIFGRENFLLDIAWHRKVSPANDAKFFSNDNDHLFVYAKSLSKLKINKLARTEKNNAVFKNPDKDERGPWNSVTMTGNKTKDERPNLYYRVIGPNGQEVWPPDGLTWRVSPDTYEEMAADNAIYWGKDGSSKSPRIKRFATEAKPIIPRSLWHYDDVGHTQQAMLESKNLFGQEAFFATPKPERLLRRVLEIATKPGDLVLDSFLGSGTTAAVAHKMGRRWVGVEMGEHARTHCVPRLKKVVEGEQGGVSRDVNWEGGGGFSFYTLGERMFDDNEQINPAIGFAALASHIIFSETGKATTRRQFDTPLIGEHEGSAYYLLFNGILGEKSAKGGNVLTKAILKGLPPFDGPKIIYGEACLIPEEQHEELGIVFRMTPYSIKGR
jgi:adenine-specific DNA-methyltransferase